MISDEWERGIGPWVEQPCGLSQLLQDVATGRAGGLTSECLRRNYADGGNAVEHDVDRRLVDARNIFVTCYDAV